jgi:two-component system, chemotaxis family, chemotaxis protein CheY
MRILIVDDSRSIQKSVSWRLQKLGHEIVGYGSDGDEGLRLYRELKPDLVMLDITMPNKDGRECLRIIKEEDDNAMVIMLSALNSESVMAECISLGARAFVQKEKLTEKGYLEGIVDSLPFATAIKAA